MAAAVACANGGGEGGGGEGGGDGGGGDGGGNGIHSAQPLQRLA